jgi:hypothetical protein
MIRSNSWMAAVVNTVFRLLDMQAPAEPTLPISPPLRDFRADNQLPADTWINAAENGEGISVFVPIGNM